MNVVDKPPVRSKRMEFLAQRHGRIVAVFSNIPKREDAFRILSEEFSIPDADVRRYFYRYVFRAEDKGTDKTVQPISSETSEQEIRDLLDHRRHLLGELAQTDEQLMRYIEFLLENHKTLSVQVLNSRRTSEELIERLRSLVRGDGETPLR